MAKLHDKPYPGDWSFNEWETVEEYLKRVDQLFDAIPNDRLVRFPIADGYAHYYVKSFRPLTLQHIPYGDAWQIPAAHMRGLRRADVERMIASAARMRKLFS